MTDEQNQCVSHIMLVDGTTVDIKDQKARLELNNILSRLEALEKFVYSYSPISEFDDANIMDSGLISDIDSVELDVFDLGTII